MQGGCGSESSGCRIESEPKVLLPMFAVAVVLASAAAVAVLVVFVDCPCRCRCCRCRCGAGAGAGYCYSGCYCCSRYEAVAETCAAVAEQCRG